MLFIEFKLIEKTLGLISDRVQQVRCMIMTGNRRLVITGPRGSTTGGREKIRRQQIARKVRKGGVITV